mgnify:CR=1 FL=1
MLGGIQMVRSKRIISETGIYHVMTRGNNKDNIFVDREDKEKYLNILRKKKAESNFIIYAYCIMTNHSHLIIKEDEEDLSDIMRKVNTSYAIYFNKKYDRVGYVFQDRYKSETIEDDSYLLTAIRYVHNNPINAMMVKKCEDFPWSSYNYYIGKKKDNLVDVEFVLSLFSEDTFRSIELFKKFSNEPNDDIFIDICKIGEKPDIEGYYEAKEFIKRYLKAENLTLKDLKDSKNKAIRNDLILYLRKSSDLSIRDIAKLLDLGRGTIYKNLTEGRG